MKKFFTVLAGVILAKFNPNGKMVGYEASHGLDFLSEWFLCFLKVG